MGKREVHYRSKVRGELYRKARYPFSSSILFFLKNRLTAACLFPNTALHLLGRKNLMPPSPPQRSHKKQGIDAFEKWIEILLPFSFLVGKEGGRSGWCMTWKTTNSQRFLCCSNSCVDKIRTKTYALEFSPKFSPMFALEKTILFPPRGEGGFIHQILEVGEVN